MAKKLPFAKLLLTQFLNTFFTTNDNYFRTATDEACDAFNKIMTEFGYTEKLAIYDPTKHQTHARSNILFTNLN